MVTKTRRLFSFKELDQEGKETLEAMALADKLNEWFYQTTSTKLEGRILEVGSGIGNISTFYLKDHRRILLSDLRHNYCQYLEQRFEGEPFLEGVLQLNLVHPDFDTKYSEFLNSFDSLFALNVIEHIEDDHLAIANARKLLRKGGRMLILVPAYQFLYNQFDRTLHHYRRYNSASLSQLFLDNDLEIERCQFFNFVGILGWFFSGTILRKKIIPGGQMKLYNSLVPIFKVIDKMLGNKAGLSVLVEGVKV